MGRRRTTTSTTEVKKLLRQKKKNRIKIKSEKKQKGQKRQWRRGGFCDSSSSPNYISYIVPINQSKIDRLSMIIILQTARIISLDCHAVCFACCPPCSCYGPLPVPPVRGMHATHISTALLDDIHTYYYIVHQHERGFS